MCAGSPREPQGTPYAPLTSFVGRNADLAEVRARLQETRLVTLTGVGGVGKTRLALEVADRVRRAFRDGIWVVELAPLEDATLVATTAAAALRVPDQSTRSATERVVGHLQGKTTLLVVDNCEHVIAEAAALVAAILDGVPTLRVLTTSREPLGLRGEQVCVVDPLAVPSALDVTGTGALDDVPAVRLLLDRARSLAPDFAVTSQNREVIAALCTRLDGIPLAIELAASRLRSLSISQLLDRLDQRFRLLAGSHRDALPRQQTLRALIDWSHDLCTEQERLLWERLSVFPGSVDLDAVEAVCGFGALPADSIADVLDHLVAKSVLTPDRSAERVRYRQFVTLREYGAEHLAASGEAQLLRRRHRDHYLRRASGIVDRWCGPSQAEDLALLREDHPNLLSALEWSVATDGEAPLGARLASSLRYHWIAGGFLSEGRQWLERLLERVGPRTPERGDCLWVAAWVALIQGDRNVAHTYLDEGADVAEELDDGALRSHITHWRALELLFAGQLDEAMAMYGLAIAEHRRRGDLAAELTAAFQLGMAQTYAGRSEEALATCREVMQAGARHGERWTRAYSHWVSGLCHVHLGRPIEAKADVVAALEIQRDFRDGICTALTIELTSWVAASYGHDENAAILSGAARSVWTRLGTTVSAFGPHLTAEAQSCNTTIDERLGTERARTVRAQHASVTFGEAIDLALGLAAAAGDPMVPTRPRSAHRESAVTGRASRAKGDAEGRSSTTLTKREIEVARLIARGLSNKAIAQALVISPRTVDGHLERILAKLEFTSRTQVAAWMGSRPAGTAGPEMAPTTG